MHGSVGSSCAVADVQSDQATIYSPTQGVWYQKTTGAMILGLKPENVHVIFRRGVGLLRIERRRYRHLRRRGSLASRRQTGARAALPQRRDGLGKLRQRLGASTNAPASTRKGNIIAWEHESWTPGLGNRPGPATPGNVITGMLLGYRARAVLARPRRRSPEALQQQQQRNSVLRRRPRRRRHQRHRHREEREGPGPQRALAFLDRPAALPRAPAKYLRARKLHG